MQTTGSYSSGLQFCVGPWLKGLRKKNSFGEAATSDASTPSPFSPPRLGEVLAPTTYMFVGVCVYVCGKGICLVKKLPR